MEHPVNTDPTHAQDPARDDSGPINDSGNINGGGHTRDGGCTRDGGYAYDNDGPSAVYHHAALAMLLDEVTQQRITDLIDLRNAWCVDVAAGAGTIAGWLASRVGPFGHVLATDIKPGLIPGHTRLTIKAHDITTSPLPQAPFHLIHARLLLNHLPRRRTAVANMISSLRPGGILLTSDFQPARISDLVLTAPSHTDVTLLHRFHSAHLKVLRDHGGDRTWPVRAPHVFEEFGLTKVDQVTYPSTWRGGGAGCRLLAAVLDQIHDQLRADGFPMEHTERLRRLLADPELTLTGHTLISTNGQLAG
jgi:SAM-dependent methyltransferase